MDGMRDGEKELGAAFLRMDEETSKVLLRACARMEYALLADMAALREEFAGEVLWEGDESQFVN